MRWEVPLEGAAVDLDRLVVLGGGHSVERRTRDQCVLTSPSFESLPNERTVLAVAQALLQTMNAAARLDDVSYQLVRLSGAVFWEGEGLRDVFDGDEATVRDHEQVTVVTVGGDPWRVAPQRTLGARALAANHAGVNDALRFWNAADWAGWYKVLEVVRGEIDPVANGCVSRGEESRFAHTANHQAALGDKARHARMRTAPPSHPMSDADGQDFARRLIECLVRHIESQS
jgi:hypothetical protein